MRAQGTRHVDRPRLGHKLGLLRSTTEFGLVDFDLGSSSACHVLAWDRASLPPWIWPGRGFPGPYTMSLVLRNERCSFDRCPAASIRSDPALVPR